MKSLHYLGYNCTKKKKKLFEIQYLLLKKDEKSPLFDTTFMLLSQVFLEITKRQMT